METEAVPALERALELGLGGSETAKARTWLASSYSKTGRHSEAIAAVARAEELGGHVPVWIRSSCADRTPRNRE